MTQEGLVELARLEIDGRALYFEQGVVVLGLEAPGVGRWHAVLRTASLATLAAPATPSAEGLLVARSLDGERLSGRVSLTGAAMGAGCLRLTGIGALQRGESGRRAPRAPAVQPCEFRR